MGKPLFGTGKGEPKKGDPGIPTTLKGVEGRKGQNRASKGNGREPEPRGRTRGSRHWGPTYGVKTQTIHRFSSLHHSLRERTGEGPVSSVPAATAVGWDWWKKRLSNLPRQTTSGKPAGSLLLSLKSTSSWTILLSP
ncbi:hypothetical protein AAFF_G00157760 [Aldrovandia affinis]|uniref:Uncharacterized protein n=1 Tax=Aldrovandia affinis TaxID=143900 RepID=A0AAD7RNF6_9TELE|nr:hypothetical protein AAFF_G00157760 [Aldrovandia affinis]